MVDILFVVPDLHRGGVGRCVYFMLEELPRHGLTTSLFCMREIEHEFSPSKANVTRGVARKLGYRLIDHRLELYAVPLKDDKNS